MAQTVSDVMTTGPVSVTAGSTLSDVARKMREHDIGAVVVEDGGSLRGLVTGRDIVVRGIAAGLDPTTTAVAEVCSAELVTVEPDDPIEAAVSSMREHSLRRLLVVEGDRVVGIVSLGDLAIERDPESALADVSAARPNA
jgi:CBS domain-containing protein